MQRNEAVSASREWQENKYPAEGKFLHLAYVINRILALFCLVVTAASAMAQNLSFSPGTDYSATIPMELYSEHYIYVGHDSPDSALISWRRIENTCPDAWDLQICDYQHCYATFTNYGDMNPVGPGQVGNLRILVNPFNEPGSGYLHYWIFPTGQMEEAHTDVYYYFNTEVTSIENTTGSAGMVTFSRNEMCITQSTTGHYTLRDLCGKTWKTYSLGNGTHRISTEDLPAGVYLLTQENGYTWKFLKP